MIQQAAIYKLIDKNKILIHNVAKLQMGAGIASEPFVWLDGNSPYTVVAEQLLNVLNVIPGDLPNPANWKESANNFLRSIGLKKQSDLYKNSIHVGVLQKDQYLYFTAMKNLGSKGFVNVSKDKMGIDANAEIEDIAKVLKDALNMCE